MSQLIAAKKEVLYVSGKKVYTCEMQFLIIFYVFWNISQRRVQDSGTSKMGLFVTLANVFQLSAVTNVTKSTVTTKKR